MRTLKLILFLAIWSSWGELRNERLKDLPKEPPEDFFLLDASRAALYNMKRQTYVCCAYCRFDISHITYHVQRHLLIAMILWNVMVQTKAMQPHQVTVYNGQTWHCAIHWNGMSDSKPWCTTIHWNVLGLTLPRNFTHPFTYEANTQLKWETNNYEGSYQNSTHKMSLELHFYSNFWKQKVQQVHGAYQLFLNYMSVQYSYICICYDLYIRISKKWNINWIQARMSYALLFRIFWTLHSIFINLYKVNFNFG